MRGGGGGGGGGVGGGGGGGGAKGDIFGLLYFQLFLSDFTNYCLILIKTYTKSPKRSL